MSSSSFSISGGKREVGGGSLESFDRTKSRCRSDIVTFSGMVGQVRPFGDGRLQMQLSRTSSPRNYV